MLLTLLIQLAAIIILIIVAGIFASSEIAIVAVRSSRIKELISAGRKGADFVTKLKSNPDDFFAVIEIGVTVTTTAASAMAGAAAITIIGPLIRQIPVKAIQAASEPISVALVILVVSYSFIVLSSLVPKAFAIRKSESIALWAGPLMWYCLKATSVIIKILVVSTNFVLRFLGMPPRARPEMAISEEEVKLIIKEGYERGVFDKDEQRLIASVFEFADTTVRRAMTPRTEIVAFDVRDPPDIILRKALEEGYTRYPIYEDNLDSVTGIIHSRDLLYVYTHRELFTIADIIRPPYFVPDSKKISDLLREMQKSKNHMAIVLDEFGGTAGIITMEDILEEIVGDIQDEYDVEEVSKLVYIDNNIAIVRAGMPVDEFSHEFGVKISGGDFETVGGMVVTKLGRIPAKNETTQFEGFTLNVHEKEGHRIKSLIARKKPVKHVP